VSQPEAIRQAFSRTEPLIAEVGRYVRTTLEPYARDNGYIFVDRAKGVGSLSEKLESGRYPAWSGLDDLYGCTIVVPVSSHEEAVLNKLSTSFQTRNVKSRASAKKAPDVFRFDGVRWYGMIREEAAILRQPGIGDIIFEVQVITAFEYAWKTVTHDLVYKADAVDWRKERLAAQLKAAVEQIEIIISAFESASLAVLESPWPESSMRSAIVSRLAALFDEDLIPETLRPQSWSRFADNVIALVKSFRGDPNRREETLSRILDTIDEDLRNSERAPLPVSGTLFQYVLSIISRTDTPGDISRFRIVPSRELNEFYGVREVPLPFVFDGVAMLDFASEEPGETESDESNPAVHEVSSQVDHTGGQEAPETGRMDTEQAEETTEGGLEVSEPGKPNEGPSSGYGQVEPGSP
jgi:ppGpp synthetase/RelA/SpoT-type nucleotidyltranferase